MSAPELFAENVEWCNGIARKLSRQLPQAFEWEDLAQEGLMALWKAANSYSADRNDNFRGYAYISVRGAMLMKTRRKHWKAATMGEDIGPMIPTLVSPHNESHDEVLSEHRRELRQLRIIRGKLEQFPSAAWGEEYFVRRHYLEGRDLAGVAAEFGTSEADARKRLRGGLSRLKAMIAR